MLVVHGINPGVGLVALPNTNSSQCIVAFMYYCENEKQMHLRMPKYGKYMHIKNEVFGYVDYSGVSGHHRVQSNYFSVHFTSTYLSCIYIIRCKKLHGHGHILREFCCLFLFRSSCLLSWSHFFG